MSIESFMKKRPYLLWYVKDYKHLSEGAALEAVLNYGDFDDVKKLLSILKPRHAYKIFKKQLRKKRVNYRPEISNYFRLYFEHYA